MLVTRVPAILGALPSLHAQVQQCSFRPWTLIARRPNPRYRDLTTASSTSTSSGRRAEQDTFPFPSHRNPTPQQIFHLPSNASRLEVKHRYYQLVKLHHPDSPLCRSVPADVRHERFKAIKDAYDILRGKSASPRNPQMDELARRRRSSPDMDGRRWTGNHNEWGGFVYEDINATQPTHASWMSVERLFILIFGFAIAGSIFHMVIVSPAEIVARRHRDAQHSLEVARRGRLENGQMRREDIRKWVEEGGMTGFGSNIGHGGVRSPGRKKSEPD